MRRRTVTAGLGVSLALVAGLLVQAGCDSGAPPVSASNTEVTVHGKVSYKGGPVKEGEIRFDPSNIKRRDAPIASAKIGEDGSYTVKTLQGENTVRFNVPTLAKDDFAVTSATILYDAPAGDSTKDFDITPAQP